MIKQIELTVPPEVASGDSILIRLVRKELRLKNSDKVEFKKIKSSIDARSKHVKVILKLEVYVNESTPLETELRINYKQVSGGKKVIIVGAGPAGYFAALELIENGLKPVIFERGKDVRSRRKDLRAIQQFSIVNPDSNYCFGEGGAGTYSDGKFYTRSHKRGSIEKALKILVEHGAKPDILYESRPHIGSNKLPGVVQSIRETILHFGGEIHFNSKMTDIIISKDTACGIIVNDGQEFVADAVILATGHSARDVFYLLKEKNILIEPKPFAIGSRIEHPQELIDEIQYKQKPRNRYLPAAAYSLVCQIRNRGVFSFCMCPGGLIVPSATAPGEIVVNGMSMSARDSRFANSGIVVSIEMQDMESYSSCGALSFMEFQKDIERKFFDTGDNSQRAPAQRMTDFVNGKLSEGSMKSSYIPGIYSGRLDELFPEKISLMLKAALVEFGKKMKGYFTSEGILVGPESRTSSPVRIPRNNLTYEHVTIKNLFPCGEGAGYAGGIISAALDGQNVARAIAKK